MKFNSLRPLGPASCLMCPSILGSDGCRHPDAGLAPGWEAGKKGCCGRQGRSTCGPPAGKTSAVLAGRQQATTAPSHGSAGPAFRASTARPLASTARSTSQSHAEHTRAASAGQQPARVAGRTLHNALCSSSMDPNVVAAADSGCNLYGAGNSALEGLSSMGTDHASEHGPSPAVAALPEIHEHRHVRRPIPGHPSANLCTGSIGGAKEGQPRPAPISQASQHSC